MVRRANGQAYPYYMPILAGNGGESEEGNPVSWYSMSTVQFLILQQWAEGNFKHDPKETNIKPLKKIFIIYFLTPARNL